ncbi:5-oxoprolinase subunit PxpA [Sediminibacillus massiliensis]|uniref:5-oxoprolinase subunit PxpA n=1 Tax=Sediminibacillus massiliensis TaxID=1926277 RepID=UPI0009888F3A|nr:5-oxoprolinase subunit PxpA [Sediminibacillus massiliensis]
MYTANLNCDMGEGYGRYELGNDKEMMYYISSANIACGFHAGDPGTMSETVQLAIEKQVKIGAHPGLPDLHGFGRRFMQITPEEAYQLVVYQTGALSGFLKAYNGKLSHVKPHGALYNMAAKDAEISKAIVQAVKDIDDTVTLFGLANSELTKAAEEQGLPVAHEVFVDRTYQDDGTLTPRSQPNALQPNEEAAINQVIEMITSNSVTTLSGRQIPIKADTICIHGDSPFALPFVKQLQARFEKEGITLE